MSSDTRRPVVSRYPYGGRYVITRAGRVYHVEAWTEKQTGGSAVEHRLETEVQPTSKGNGPLQVTLVDAAGVRHVHRVAHLRAQAWGAA
ncbi:hypothetical protein [Mycobacterium avium]|uniref:hypothetical protein n=1 Tax=Mycobacterium avium TaxID=1764 RepID=UPI0026650293|nr:hypothetical protein [Mycobacterium avium]MDO2354671.1 hypothetical protein [Mycobacterium avium subsp. hominissuis]